MAHLLIFGLGYTAKRIAAGVEALGWSVEATGSAGTVDFADKNAVLKALGQGDSHPFVGSAGQGLWR